MLFSSLSFLLFFLPLLFSLYYVIPSIRYKNVILFVFSLIFYAWGEPKYILLMIFSIVFNYTFVLIIEMFKNRGNIIIARIIFVSLLMVNVNLLVIFKYSDFLIRNINRFFGLGINLLNLTLPIGISFYTFQIMSYVIDAYCEKVKVQKNLITLGTYIVLFPQLIAGPIVRYKTIENELEIRNIYLDNIYNGLSRFIIGLGKKIIIANQVALIADKIFEQKIGSIGIEIAWLGIIAYSLQIYFDFSGYSDMAIGLGRILGFNFLENFDYPYIAKSVTEFWRRWHISLSTWFRDYVYIPMGGNRVKKLRWIANIFVVWFLTGLWHGASWNFVLWGLYYGFILVFEKLILSNLITYVPNFIRHIYTLFVIIMGWVIFRLRSIKRIITYSLALIGYYGHSEVTLFYNLSITSLLIYVVFGVVGSTPLLNNLIKKINKNGLVSAGYDIVLITVFLVCILFLINNSFNPFIYFRF